MALVAGLSGPNVPQSLGVSLSVPSLAIDWHVHIVSFAMVMPPI